MTDLLRREPGRRDWVCDRKCFRPQAGPLGLEVYSPRDWWCCSTLRSTSRSKMRKAIGWHCTGSALVPRLMRLRVRHTLIQLIQPRTTIQCPTIFRLHFHRHSSISRSETVRSNMLLLESVWAESLPGQSSTTHRRRRATPALVCEVYNHWNGS